MKKLISLISCLFLISLFQNCTAFDSSDEFLPSGGIASSLRCSPNDPRLPNRNVLKRLGKMELKYTITDLFKNHMTDQQRLNFQAHIEAKISKVPDDNTIEGMSVSDSRVSPEHIEALFSLSESVADFISEKENIMSSIVGACYSNSNDACERDFIKNFGLKVFRRPLSDDDISHFKSVMDGYKNPFRNAIASFINSPAFYYHIQNGVSTNSGVVSLTPYERASKLSYLFLRSMPDRELFESANSGKIMSREGVLKEIDRLLKNPIVRERLTKDFANEWLHLKNTSDLNLNISEVQDRFSAIKAKDTSLKADDLKKSLIKEAYDYLDYMLWERNANYNEVMTSNLVFPRNELLANIYGTKQWSGSYDDLIRAPADQRSGVLTQARFLYTGSASTRPIMRGVHVYHDFLCGNLTLPPDNDTPEGVEITDHMSDQEYVKAITEKEGSSCVGCHKGIINPIGFTFDNFDSLGKFRVEEKVYHPEYSSDAGKVLTLKPVKSYSSIRIGNKLNGDFENAVDLAKHLGKSSQANSCFSSKIWNFSQKQNLSFGKDPCAINDLTRKVSASSIIETFKEVAIQPEFMKRKVQ